MLCCVCMCVCVRGLGLLTTPRRCPHSDWVAPVDSSRCSGWYAPEEDGVRRFALTTNSVVGMKAPWTTRCVAVRALLAQRVRWAVWGVKVCGGGYGRRSPPPCSLADMSLTVYHERQVLVRPIEQS
jgi:hypothetical protein